MKLKLARCEALPWFMLTEEEQKGTCEVCPNMYNGACLREARQVSDDMAAKGLTPTLWDMPVVLGGLTKKERGNGIPSMR